MHTIQKMFEHLHWANKRILETLQKEEDKPLIIKLFAHILQAEQVWITRLQGKDSSALQIWSDADVAICAQLVKQNDELFKTFFSNLTNEGLDRLVSYSNSTGKEFHNSIRDILIHVALHGQYHRGQINTRLRAEDSEPVNVDFITFVR